MAQIIKHPAYGNVTDIDMDVALIKVRRPFRLNNRTVRTVKLTDVGKDMPSGELATVTGWGNLGVCTLYFNITIKYPIKYFFRVV